MAWRFPIEEQIRRLMLEPNLIGTAEPCTCPTAAQAVAGWSADAMIETLRELRAKFPRPEFDALACTQEVHDELVRQTVPQMRAREVLYDPLGSLPVYLVANRFEAMKLGWELAKKGKRLAYCGRDADGVVPESLPVPDVVVENPHA